MVFRSHCRRSVRTLESWPAPAAVTTYGPAYRYPVGGWIYLHVEGQPYERGYQHGHLMAKEIPQYMERCAAELDPKGKNKSWNLARTTATALFLHGFDQEILAEMKGIADGASDAGARWEGRPIDLTDIVVVNTTVELGDLSAALAVTPNGLEGLRLAAPSMSRTTSIASPAQPWIIAAPSPPPAPPLAMGAWLSATPPGGRSRWPNRPT